MSSSTDSSHPNQPAEPAGGRFAIHKIYVKDVSFETPNSPESFRAEWKPDVDIQLNNDARPVAANVFEVVLRITVTAKIDGNVVFLVEVHQAGIFEVAGLNAEMGPMLGSYCPNILFPYARETISDLITRGGFPQFLLAPVNFDALYAQHLAQEARESAGEPAH